MKKVLIVFLLLVSQLSNAAQGEKYDISMSRKYAGMYFLGGAMVVSGAFISGNAVNALQEDPGNDYQHILYAAGSTLAVVGGAIAGFGVAHTIQSHNVKNQQHEDIIVARFSFEKTLKPEDIIVARVSFDKTLNKNNYKKN